MKVLYWCVSFALLLPAVSPAQEATAPEVSIVQPKGEVIDGSKEPDRVPDIVAWRMVFRVLADGPKAFPYKTRASFLDDTGLSEGQVIRVIIAANQVAGRVKDMEERIMNSTLQMDEMTQALRSQRDSIINDVVGDLLIQQLDPEGAGKLLQYLRQRVKRGIMIVK